METTRAGIAIYKINYQSDFTLTVVCDVEWGTPFCIKFWTGEPAQAYYVGWDGKEYRNCKVVESDPSKLLVLFDDHHLPVGELKMQIVYHTTIEDFPNAIVDEVTNSMKVIAFIDGKNQKIALDFEGEEAAELQFELPAYANEAQRIANEEQRIANEQSRIEAEQQRIDNEQTRQDNEAQRITQETARVNEYAELKADAVAATDAANDAATLANQKAQLAADKAALADAAATLANQKAQLAADKAALADAAATLANQKAEYADAQGDYAKEQGDYAKEQGDTALADHRRAESDHETAVSDHTIAANDHTQAGNDHTRAESDHSTAADDHTLAASDHSTAAADHTLAASDHSTAAADHTLAASDHSTAADDHTQAGNDHTRAESDHTRAENDHAAVEVYVDSLGAFDISSYHATGGTLAKYADLTAALGTGGANIPEAIRKGGMSVKFVQSSDNKYVQFRYMGTDVTGTPNPFLDAANWQGVDDTPTAGSDNLVKSRGIAQYVGLPAASLDISKETARTGNIGTITLKAGHSYKAVVTRGDTGRYNSLSICSGTYSSPGTIYMGFAFAADDESLSKETIYTNSTNSDIEANIVVRGSWGSDYWTDLHLVIIESNNNLIWTSNQNLTDEQREQVWENLNIRQDDKPKANSDNFVKSKGLYAPYGVLFDLSQDEYIVEKPTWAIRDVSDGIGTIKPFAQTWTIHYIPCFKGVKYKLVTSGPSAIDDVTVGIANHIVTTSEQISVIFSGSPIKTENTFEFEATMDGYLYIAHTITISILSLSTSSKLAAVEKDVEGLDERTTELELQDKEIPLDNVQGLQYLDIRENGEIYARASYYYTYYFLSEVGKCYKLVINCSNNAQVDAVTIGYSNNIPASGGTVSIFSRYTPKFGENTTIVKGNGKYICCAFYINPNTLSVYRIANKELVYDHIVSPAKLYAIKYNPNGFNLLNRLYVEGIVNNDLDKDILIDGAPSIFAEEENPETVGNKIIRANISMPNSYPYNMGISIQRVNPLLLQNKNVRISMIGDSLTVRSSATPDFITKCLNQDYGNISPVYVGSRKRTGTIKMGDYEFTCETSYDGRGGWSIADYLRKAFHTNYYGTTGGGGDSMPGKVSWDSLGLATKTRNGVPGRESKVEFSDSIENAYEIRNACHGWYDADPSAELWDWIVNKREIHTFTYNGVQYSFGSSYSSADDAAQIAAIKYLCSEDWDGINPFYDIDTVQSTGGQYAFNYAKYLSRYKTLADDGVTRLVVGETAGTRITNITSCDLCTPSHVCLVMSTNGSIEPADAEQTVDDLILCGDLIKAVDNTIKVIIGSPRPYGFCNPQLYTETGCFKSYTFSQRLFNCNELLKQKITASGHIMIDLYAVQSPSGYMTKSAFDTLDGSEKIRDTGDGTHGEEFIGYMDRAYQFVSAIISTLN